MSERARGSTGILVYGAILVVTVGAGFVAFFIGYASGNVGVYLTGAAVCVIFDAQDLVRRQRHLWPHKDRDEHLDRLEWRAVVVFAGAAAYLAIDGVVPSWLSWILAAALGRLLLCWIMPWARSLVAGG